MNSCNDSDDHREAGPVPGAMLDAVAAGRMAQITRGVLFLSIATAIALLAANVFVEGRITPTMWVIAAAIPAFILLLELVRRGRTRWAVAGLVVALYIVMIGVVVSRGTVKVPATSFVIVATALAGLVHGRVAMYAALVGGILVFGGLSLAESGGLLSLAEPAPLFAYWIGISAFAVATGVIVSYARDIAEDALRGSARELAERKLQTEQLRRLHEELEQRVAARTHELQVANHELESFSYSVSHDLRAPLRAIDGFCKILLEDHAAQLDAQGRRYLGRVSDGAGKMAELIDSLLKLSRISRQEMQIASVDLSALVRDSAAELAALEPARRVEWVVAPEVQANGDRDLLIVAMRNLLGNAWKYTSKLDRARIEFGLCEHHGRTAYFVRDNGAGFDMAYAAKLFGAFQRLHSPAEFAGTGIGLATVARIVHRHGGEVWGEAKVGEGATFYFTL